MAKKRGDKLTRDAVLRMISIAIRGTTYTRKQGFRDHIGRENDYMVWSGRLLDMINSIVKWPVKKTVIKNPAKGWST